MRLKEELDAGIVSNFAKQIKLINNEQGCELKNPQEVSI